VNSKQPRGISHLVWRLYVHLTKNLNFPKLMLTGLNPIKEVMVQDDQTNEVEKEQTSQERVEESAPAPIIVVN
jgi:hypothetical protein